MLEEATEARSWPADNPRAGDLFLGRVPNAQHWQPVRKSTKWWKMLERRIPKHTSAASSFGAVGAVFVVGRDSRPYLRLLGVILHSLVETSPIRGHSKYLNIWGRMSAGDANEKYMWRLHSMSQMGKLHCTALQTETSQENCGAVRVCELSLWAEEQSSPNVLKV